MNNVRRLQSGTTCKTILPCILRLRHMNELWVVKTLFQYLYIFISCSETIFTSWEQSVANVTWYVLFLVHYIVQMGSSTSEWSGDKLTLVFLASTELSKLARVLYQLCPEWISFSSYNSSVKLLHHLSGMWDSALFSPTLSFV